MIDMKQIKENVANRIKTTQAQEPAMEFPVRENKPQTTSRESSAAIGASIRIKGDVTGDENLIIQGHVEGTIKVQGHNVTISKTGKVKANIEANQIIVEGELQGDMLGDEKVIIRETGNVHGNIVAPRVTLEDGALFKGSIEMEPRQKGMNTGKPATTTSPGSFNSEQKTA
ncbi:MAG: polymer-forming cytoskeletal protein [Gammaproteobacteria bacterium]|nr:polymer-forming cytoskeletal protein [Gammaproteobacteria bacterium]